MQRMIAVLATLTMFAVGAVGCTKKATESKSKPTAASKPVADQTAKAKLIPQPERPTLQRAADDDSAAGKHNESDEADDADDNSADDKSADDESAGDDDKKE